MCITGSAKGGVFRIILVCPGDSPGDIERLRAIGGVGLQCIVVSGLRRRFLRLVVGGLLFGSRQLRSLASNLLASRHLLTNLRGKILVLFFGYLRLVVLASDRRR